MNPTLHGNDWLLVSCSHTSLSYEEVSCATDFGGAACWSLDGRYEGAAGSSSGTRYAAGPECSTQPGRQVTPLTRSSTELE